MALSWLHRWLKRKSRPVSRTARKPFGGKRFLPNLELLGERIVPSTFHVTTLADAGAGSLRAAVAQANAHAGADKIVFDDGLTGTIALTGGELDVTDDLKVNGPGADKLTVSGSNLSRVFQVEAGETLLPGEIERCFGPAGVPALDRKPALGLLRPLIQIELAETVLKPRPLDRLAALLANELEAAKVAAKRGHGSVRPTGARRPSFRRHTSLGRDGPRPVGKVTSR